VEILTHKKPAPSRDWMNASLGYLRTSSARTKVRQWFREQGRDTAVVQGKEIAERELSRLDLKHTKLEDIAVHMSYESIEDMFAAIGFGIKSAASVGSVALQLERDKAPPAPIVTAPTEEHSKGIRKAASGVSLGGVDDILGKRARCCSPLPGDSVLGYISRGRGIIIHRRDCLSIDVDREPERWVEIDWGPGGQEKHPVDVEIRASDRQGLLRDLSDLIIHAGAAVRSVRADARSRDGTARIRLALDFVSSAQVVRVLDKLDHHPDVIAVRRVSK
jgi:GTP pyrophosphokinase